MTSGEVRDAWPGVLSSLVAVFFSDTVILPDIWGNFFNMYITFEQAGKQKKKKFQDFRRDASLFRLKTDPFAFSVRGFIFELPYTNGFPCTGLNKVKTSFFSYDETTPT